MNADPHTGRHAMSGTWDSIDAPHMVRIRAAIARTPLPA